MINPIYKANEKGPDNLPPKQDYCNRTAPLRMGDKITDADIQYMDYLSASTRSVIEVIPDVGTLCSAARDYTEVIDASPITEIATYIDITRIIGEKALLRYYRGGIYYFDGSVDKFLTQEAANNLLKNNCSALIEQYGKTYVVGEFEKFLNRAYSITA